MIKDEEYACQTRSLFAYSSNLAKHVTAPGRRPR